MVQVISGLVLFEERLPIELIVNSKGARTFHLSLSSMLCLEVYFDFIKRFAFGAWKDGSVVKRCIFPHLSML